MKIKLMILFLFVLFVNISAQNKIGIIKGTVIDKISKESLTGANVLIVGTTVGSSTNLDGEFEIVNVTVGTNTLRFSFIGYETIIKTDVVVRPGRITFVNVELNPTTIESGEVSVTAGYFHNKDESNINAVAFNAEEIKRSPGSMGDVSRILMAMPSTSKVSDDHNDLAVRGGSPIENGFYIDGISVPNINHFPSIGSTGGPIGILNIDFIDNVNFLTSGFSPKYGDRLSSVVDISYREGNKDKFEMQADLNISGFGGGAEGPLLGGNGSWMISGKKSYLDIVMDLFFDSQAMPHLTDVQGKVVYEFDKKHKLNILDIFAHNSEEYNREDAIDLGTDDYGNIENLQNTLGLSWRALWSSSFYSITSISHSLMKFTNEFYNVSNNKLNYKGKNAEQFINFRNSNFVQPGSNHRLEFGVEFKYEIGKYDYTQVDDTTRLGTVKPTFVVDKTIKSVKAGLFVNYIVNPFDKLTISAGIRNDYYSLNKANVVSPRFAVSYDISNLFKVYANGGIFYQQLPMYLLSQSKEFENLKNIKAIHYGIGFDYLLSEDTKLTVEFYDKEYSNLPLDATDPSRNIIDDGLSTQDFGNYTSLSNSGKAFTRGVELLIQKKLAEDIYGLISGSIFRSRYQGYSGEWYDRVYDNQYIFSIIGGYKPSEEWEFSARWTYAGGGPYTPYDLEKSINANKGIIDQNKINSKRLPAYHSLNLRIDKKFFFSNQTLDIYLSLWNVYNRENVYDYSWNTEEKKVKPDLQWGLLPIIGVEYEF